MTLSVVINTCALGPRAADTRGSGRFASPHAWRAYALRNFVLPHYIRWGAEVIVAGEWEPGAGYHYVPCPSEHFNCTDALAQRHAGFAVASAVASGDQVLFQHDDHILDHPPTGLADVLVPERRTRLRYVQGEHLNNGERDGYISGHCALYRRAVIEACPWAAVPRVFTWDIEHTKQILAAGFEIGWTDEATCWDIEMGAEPWR